MSSDNKGLWTPNALIEALLAEGDGNLYWFSGWAEEGKPAPASPGILAGDWNTREHWRRLVSGSDALRPGESRRVIGHRAYAVRRDDRWCRIRVVAEHLGYEIAWIDEVVSCGECYRAIDQSNYTRPLIDLPGDVVCRRCVEEGRLTFSCLTETYAINSCYDRYLPAWLSPADIEAEEVCTVDAAWIDRVCHALGRREVAGEVLVQYGVWSSDRVLLAEPETPAGGDVRRLIDEALREVFGDD